MKIIRDTDPTPAHGLERPHISNVVPLRRPVRVSPNHPSLYNRDDETPDEAS